MSKRFFLQNVAHKLVGVRGSTNFFHDQYRSSESTTRSPNFGNIYENAVQEIASNKHRLVFFGEIHSQKAVVAFECAIQEAMINNNNKKTTSYVSTDNNKCSLESIDEDEKSAITNQQPTSEDDITLVDGKQEQQSPILHVIMEHFSFEMQSLLDDYLRNGKIKDFNEFTRKYREIGTEGHDLEPYRPLLEYAKEQNNRIRVHAGFISRSYARMLLKEGIEKTMRQAIGWFPASPNQTKAMLEGTSLHYNIFESLISGRSAYPISCEGNDVAERTPIIASPSDMFRGIFKAQLLKDVAMAQKINQLLKQYQNDKFLVIAGNGHLLHYCGVPERVLKEHPEISSETCLVVSASAASINSSSGSYHNQPQEYGSESNEKSVNTTLRSVIDKFGPEGMNPADYVYLYEDLEETNVAMDVEVKSETRNAYDKVGASAHLEGSFKKAKAIMNALGYTEEQFNKMAGPDAYNFQGVGNPHLHAKILPGEKVLDIGSGLGVDSFIASHYVGKDGEVVGIDISPEQIRHAQMRSKERGLENTRFEVADMENLPFQDDTFDVVISNGAFCLAPNKQKSLAEILRVLKPGGRMSICTSTIQVGNLEPGVTWPLCMQMFIQKDNIQPLCEKLGYVDILVDDSDSSMTLELPVDVLEEVNSKRNKIHVGSPEFEHLEEYNMNEICARVCIVAHKPLIQALDITH